MQPVAQRDDMHMTIRSFMVVDDNHLPALTRSVAGLVGISFA